MAFCSSCGQPIPDSAKFCSNCGTSVSEGYSQRKIEYAGKVHKCPECGEVLKSFEINCPACGHELRSVKSSSAVKEFSLKLEAIEAHREYEKPHRFFRSLAANEQVSKTDEQKINLIKSFPVPNTKEDMLEFMILAASSMNMKTYDSTITDISKGEKEISAAWLAKIQQVYEKAKRSYSTDNTFFEIKDLYNECNQNIGKSKKRGIIKWALMFGWMPIFFIVIFSIIAIHSPGAAEKEIDRLEKIEQQAIEALENREYKEALLNAEALMYSPGVRNGESDEIERQWDVKRKLLINDILEEAAQNGVDLEYTLSEDVDKANVDSPPENTGFIGGFTEGVQSGLGDAQENIDEFNRIISGKE